jgi:hypothetical protein
LDRPTTGSVKSKFMKLEQLKAGDETFAVPGGNMSARKVHINAP